MTDETRDALVEVLKSVHVAMVAIKDGDCKFGQCLLKDENEIMLWLGEQVRFENTDVPRGCKKETR